MKSNQSQRVCMISLGCAKNLVDSEMLVGGLKQENYEIVQKSDDTSEYDMKGETLIHELETV